MKTVDYQRQENLPSEFQVAVMHLKEVLNRFGFKSHNMYFQHFVNTSTKSAGFSFSVSTKWKDPTIERMLKFGIFWYNFFYSHPVRIWKKSSCGVATKFGGPIEFHEVWIDVIFKNPTHFFGHYW